MTKLAGLFAASASPAEYVSGYCQRVAEVVAGIDAEAVASCIAVLEQAAQTHKTIFCIANGGSAAVASHFVNDMCPNSFVDGHPPYRVLCLTDNVESITAIANDFGYEEVFRHQLRALLQPGDVVLALSVSGNSENILRAVRFARERGAATVAWTGFDGGTLAELADAAVRIPTTRDEYGPVEGIFTHLAHVVSGYLTMKRGRPLGHDTPQGTPPRAGK